MRRVTDDPTTWGVLSQVGINGFSLDVFGQRRTITRSSGVTRGLDAGTLDRIARWFGTIGYGGVTTGSGEARAELCWRLFVS